MVTSAIASSFSPTMIVTISTVAHLMACVILSPPAQAFVVLPGQTHGPSAPTNTLSDIPKTTATATVTVERVDATDDTFTRASDLSLIQGFDIQYLTDTLTSSPQTSLLFPSSSSSRMAGNPFPFLSAILAQLLFPSSTSSSSIITGIYIDPNVETEALNGMTHAMLDLPTILQRNSNLAAKLMAVFGRVTAISADYLPDHFMSEQELVIQIVLLMLSFKDAFDAARSQTAKDLNNPSSTSAGTSNSSVAKQNTTISNLVQYLRLPWNK